MIVILDIMMVGVIVAFGITCEQSGKLFFVNKKQSIKYDSISSILFAVILIYLGIRLYV